jgi:hypothetical protein
MEEDLEEERSPTSLVLVVQVEALEGVRSQLSRQYGLEEDQLEE